MPFRILCDFATTFHLQLFLHYGENHHNPYSAAEDRVWRKTNKHIKEWVGRKKKKKKKKMLVIWRSEFMALATIMKFAFLYISSFLA